MKLFNNIIKWELCTNIEKKKLMMRPYFSSKRNTTKKVKEIIKRVLKEGDKALHYYNNIFDNISIKKLQVSNLQIKKSFEKVDLYIKNAMKKAILNIKKFHIAQKIKNISVNIINGIECQQIIRPINSVGLYVPGGSIPLFSTVFMLAIPAKIAKCKNIILCSPPPISNNIICAAKLCGIKKIFQIGGAQAIAALAIGTKSIPKVNKIFGPGNIWVTEAKKQINYNLPEISIDMPAGPSELLIIADKFADEEFIAADLLSQAEHGLNSQVILLTPSKKVALKVKKAIEKQIVALPRSKIIQENFSKSYIIITKNLKECTDISNTYGPEHLIIHTKKAKSLFKYIMNAGSIFLGKWTPESAGDYASGTNHVLPTYGYTKSYSSLGVSDFQKRMTVQKITPLGLKKIAPIINILSKEENLIAHQASIKIRIKKFRKKNEFQN